MFTYLDPDVRKRLVAEGKLIRVDREGRKQPGLGWMRCGRGANAAGSIRWLDSQIPP